MHAIRACIYYISEHVPIRRARTFKYCSTCLAHGHSTHEPDALSLSDWPCYKHDITIKSTLEMLCALVVCQYASMPYAVCDILFIRETKHRWRTIEQQLLHQLSQLHWVTCHSNEKHTNKLANSLTDKSHTATMPTLRTMANSYMNVNVNGNRVRIRFDGERLVVVASDFPTNSILTSFICHRPEVSRSSLLWFGRENECTARAKKKKWIFEPERVWAEGFFLFSLAPKCHFHLIQTGYSLMHAQKVCFCHFNRLHGTRTCATPSSSM